MEFYYARCKNVLKFPDVKRKKDLEMFKRIDFSATVFNFINQYVLGGCNKVFLSKNGSFSNKNLQIKNKSKKQGNEYD
jgi:hypothetical protein